MKHFIYQLHSITTRWWFGVDHHVRLSVTSHRAQICLFFLSRLQYVLETCQQMRFFLYFLLIISPWASFSFFRASPKQKRIQCTFDSYEIGREANNDSGLTTRADPTHTIQPSPSTTFLPTVFSLLLFAKWKKKKINYAF